MLRQACNKHRARGDRVHELEGEELARADEAPVVAANEEERERGEEVGEDEMCREVGVCVRDEVEPVAAGDGAIGGVRGDGGRG